jgi:hypothetical protein
VLEDQARVVVGEAQTIELRGELGVVTDKNYF